MKLVAEKVAEVRGQPLEAVAELHHRERAAALQAAGAAAAGG